MHIRLEGPVHIPITPRDFISRLCSRGSSSENAEHTIASRAILFLGVVAPRVLIGGLIVDGGVMTCGTLLEQKLGLGHLYRNRNNNHEVP